MILDKYSKAVKEIRFLSDEALVTNYESVIKLPRKNEGREFIIFCLSSEIKRRCEERE